MSERPDFPVTRRWKCDACCIYIFNPKHWTQLMPRSVVEYQRNQFLKSSRAAAALTGPASPSIEKRLKKIIQKNREYKPTVVWAPGTKMAEWTVWYASVPTKMRRVVFGETGSPPTCCTLTYRNFLISLYCKITFFHFCAKISGSCTKINTVMVFITVTH